MTSQKLPAHEWLIIILFSSILIVLSSFAIIGNNRLPFSPSASQNSSQQIGLLVKIEGEVANPGYYRFPPKTTLKHVLECAVPLPSSDISQLNLRRHIRDNQIIVIPERRPILIEVQGAVKSPGPLTILSGTRMCELIPTLDLLPVAKVSALRKKRGFVKEGDCIEIPAKKTKK